MIPIYLLEDNPEQRKKYKDFIKNTIIIHDLSMDFILDTDEPEELLNHIDQHYQGVFFLDMEINNEKNAGLLTAIKIRHKIPMAHIVFITTHEDLSFATLERKISPLDYILKDNGLTHIEQNISEDLLKVEELYKSIKYKKENIFNYHINRHYFSLPISEIIYLTVSPFNPGRVLLHSTHKEAEFFGNLNELSQKYPMFFRSDKSFLINLDHLEHFDNKTREIFFYDGSNAYASIRKARELVKLLK